MCVARQLPKVAGNDKLNGGVLKLEVGSLEETVKALKGKLSADVSLSVNKQKFNLANVGFLKDNKSLAFYNCGEDTVLNLGVKERGGRKK